jgi:hypothetical protein
MGGAPNYRCALHLLRHLQPLHTPRSNLISSQYTSYHAFHHSFHLTSHFTFTSSQRSPRLHRLVPFSFSPFSHSLSLHSHTLSLSILSARQGFTDLTHKHEMFEMSQRTAERWLKHMQASLDGMADEIAEKFRIELMNFMTYTAYYLVLCQSTQKKFETMGPYFLNPPPEKGSD